MEFKNLNILDIGNTLEIVGVVYGDIDDKQLIVYLPDAKRRSVIDTLHPTLSEWQQIIRQSDLKEIELVGGDKNKKVILRKSTRQIEQYVMWDVFRRDEFTCRCGRDDVPMTVDHIVLWEAMGPSIVQNLICSCKKCNNTRGNMDYVEWLKSDKYEEVSKNLNHFQKAKNALVVNEIPDIVANHLRVSKRNR